MLLDPNETKAEDVKEETTAAESTDQAASEATEEAVAEEKAEA